MSDDKATIVGFTACILALFVLAGRGCEVEHRTQEVRAKAPTVVTCVEHSVLDRVQVVQ